MYFAEIMSISTLYNCDHFNHRLAISASLRDAPVAPSHLDTAIDLYHENEMDSRRQRNPYQPTTLSIDPVAQKLQPTRNTIPVHQVSRNRFNVGT